MSEVGGCHENNAKFPLYLSHIFNGYLEHSTGKTLEKVNTLKTKKINELVLQKE